MRTRYNFDDTDPAEVAAMERSDRLCAEANERLARGEHQAALELFQQDRALCEAVWGQDHVFVANSLYDIGDCLCRQGEYEAALRAHQQASVIYDSVYAPDHWLTIRNLRGSAVCEEKLGRYEEAFFLDQRVRDYWERHSDTEPDEYVTSLLNSAFYAMKLERNEETIPWLMRALQIEEQQHGAGHWKVVRLLRILAIQYDKIGQTDESIRLTQRAVAIAEKTRGADHAETLDCVGKLAELYEKTGQLDLALSLRRHVLERCEAIHGEKHQDTAEACFKLADVCEKLGMEDETFALYLRGVGIEQEIRLAAEKAQDTPPADGGRVEAVHDEPVPGVDLDDEYQRTAHRSALADRAVEKAQELLAQFVQDAAEDDYRQVYWKEFDFYPLAHHRVLGYLQHLWAGGEKDEVFEQLSMKDDFHMKGLNFAALCYEVAKERQIPFQRVLHFLSPAFPEGDDPVAGGFYQIMVVAEAMNEEGVMGEVKYLGGVVCGALVDTEQSRFYTAQIDDDFASVGFAVKYCTALESLRDD